MNELEYKIISTAKFWFEQGWSGLYTTYNEPTGEENWEMVKESITVPVTTKQIERFAELVRQDEREKIKREQQACYVKRGDSK